MCDYIPGELILCFPKIDLAAQRLIQDIRTGQIGHVSHLESLEQKLAPLGLKPDEDIEFDFHRVAVPLGEELWKVTYLQFFYKLKFLELISQRQATTQFLDGIGRSDFQFTAVPNSVLDLAAKPLGKEKVQAANFTFSKFHTNYKATVNVPTLPPPKLDEVDVVIVDSGIADDIGFHIADKRNFTDPKQPENVSDENGHGTVIALILHDVAPGVRFAVYKVAEADGRVSEWNALAALAACAKYHVINLSLQFGLRDRVCRICGRESQSSRSAVFENIIGQFAQRKHTSVLVGAAGNHGVGDLAFPARFGSMLAIGAVNSKGELSSESNYGNQYVPPGDPDNHFVCPGGDQKTTPPETVGSFGLNDNLHWHGTSFAAAYASGVVANLMAQQDQENSNNTSLLEILRDKAESKILVEYDSKKHGHGLLRLPD